VKYQGGLKKTESNARQGSRNGWIWCRRNLSVSGNRCCCGRVAKTASDPAASESSEGLRVVGMAGESAILSGRISLMKFSREMNH